MEPIEHPVRDRCRIPLSARFDVDSGLDVPLGSDTRPRWRGRVHLIALCFFAPGLMMLVAEATTTRARIGAAVYAVGLCSMFTASVTYHRWVHHLRARAMWRRADHAMIFAAIAGSATPIALHVLPGPRGYALIALVWLVSLMGALCKVGRSLRGDSIGSLFYAAVSVIAALSLPALWQQEGVRTAMLVVIGGVLYVVGANGFSRMWPRLRPAVFSYHEVWHVFTVVAATAHFAAVWKIST